MERSARLLNQLYINLNTNTDNKRVGSEPRRQGRNSKSEINVLGMFIKI